MTYFQCSVLVLGFVGINVASAATYYVDSEIGNDSLSGLRSDRLASSPNAGPWQTLTRVSSAALAPGDQVRLKCGQVWRETLRVPSSGSSTLPILFGQFPAECSTPPVIDGSVDLSAKAWSLLGRNVYKTTLPLQLIDNGSFNSGVENWRTWSPSGNSRISLGTGCPPSGGNCLAIQGGTGPTNGMASSSPFRIQSMDYTISIAIRASSGSRVELIVRRDGAPYDEIGLRQTVVGTGQWQTYAFNFRGRSESAKARLDIEVPPNQSITVDDVSLMTVLKRPLQALWNGKQLNVARHPNSTYDADGQHKAFFRIPENSDNIVVSGRNVSTYLTTGSDLVLPAGIALTPGLEVRIRPNSWMLDERRIRSITGTRVLLDSPTAAPIYSEAGYLLLGALWMLDEPGEWFFDASRNIFYAWTPDGQPPGNQITLGGLVDVGIDARNRSNIVIYNIAIRRTKVGIDLSGATNVTISNQSITDTVDQGVLAASSERCSVVNNRFLRTGRDAILGMNVSTGMRASGLRVTGNDVTESGVRIERDVVVSIPVKSYAAIQGGATATITDNKIVDAGYNGIWAFEGSEVSSNFVGNTCRVLDDCGAIYVSNRDHNSMVTNNLVHRSIGALYGKFQKFTQAQGIYLDDHVTGVTVSGNTVVNADHGIQIHNSSSNHIQSNRLYGNRKYQLWLQEGDNSVRPTGDVFDNRVTGNHFVPVSPAGSVLQETKFSSLEQFATYNTNRYSTLRAPFVVEEAWNSGRRDYRFQEWQAAVTVGGVTRLLDAQGAQVSYGNQAPFRVTGGTMMINGTFGNGTEGWGTWSPTSSKGTMTAAACSTGYCMQYTAGTSYGLAHSPNFSVVAGQWYRVSFDFRTGVAGQAIVVGVRRGGGDTNGFEWLTDSPVTVLGSNAWKRHSYSFQATKSVMANDPVSGDLGARIDFLVNLPGQTMGITNVEIVPIAPVGTSLSTRILMNSSRTSSAVPCPDTLTSPSECSRYVKFSDQTPVTWPYTLGPLGSEIIFSRVDSLPDSDGDGIGDIQDGCSSTAGSQSVNARGCALGQTQ